MKMQIVVAGEDLGVWSLDELELADAFKIKSTTGLNPVAMERGLGEGDPDAWRAVIWFLRQRTKPGLPLESVTFKYGDLDFSEVEEVEAADPPVGGADAPILTSATSAITTSAS